MCSLCGTYWLEVADIMIVFKGFFCGERLHSRSCGRTAALRLIVQPCDEDEEKDD
jgi:hypothetical protein